MLELLGQKTLNLYCNAQSRNQMEIVINVVMSLELLHSKYSLLGEICPQTQTSELNYYNSSES
jgi:hypothetical protein